MEKDIEFHLDQHLREKLRQSPEKYEVLVFYMPIQFKEVLFQWTSNNITVNLNDEKQNYSVDQPIRTRHELLNKDNHLMLKFDNTLLAESVVGVAFVKRLKIEDVIEKVISQQSRYTEFDEPYCQKVQEGIVNFWQSKIEPIYQQNIEIPIRGEFCDQHQHFDLYYFLKAQENESRWSWKCNQCPGKLKRTIFPGMIKIDYFMYGVLQKLRLEYSGSNQERNVFLKSKNVLISLLEKEKKCSLEVSGNEAPENEAHRSLREHLGVRASSSSLVQERFEYLSRTELFSNEKSKERRFLLLFFASLQ